MIKNTVYEKAIKKKKCVECEELFTPTNSMQKVCSYKCAIVFSNKKKKQKESKLWSKEKSERKEKLLSYSDWLKAFQQVFNAYIRLRDKDLPCISCGANEPTKTYDAGHYRSVGAHPELRFNEDNVHKQCRKCNGYWGGNLIEYRKGLIKKIGVEKVEHLENFKNTLKLTIPEIKEKIVEYKNKIKELKCQKNSSH